MLEALDAQAVTRWSSAAAATLRSHRAELDDINVFPVPDADTGTNMALTMDAADSALVAAGASDVRAALRALATGAVVGARGNSGVLLSQVLRGLADAAASMDSFDALTLRAGLRTGADLAYAAVADPVEGTFLTVARAAADYPAASGPERLADLAVGVVRAADNALLETTALLPVLARAGVVDAGGRGLVLLLDALACTITGHATRVSVPRLVARPAHLLESARETGSGEFGYEVQYLLQSPEVALSALRSELASLGDSVAVVGTGDGVWNVHVHVNDVGAAIEAGLAAGRPYRVTVVRFADQIAAGAGAASPSAPSAGLPADARATGTAVVAVAPGHGLAHLFEAEGVWVVDAGPGRRPTAAEVAEAVRATGAADVVLLPNASNVAGVAESAVDEVRADGIQVTVVPTHSPVQGLAAVAVHDPNRRFDDDVVAMAEAAAATRYAEVGVAAAEALTSVGICQAGDVLGMIDGEVVEIGRGLVAVALALVDRLLGVGAELMTVLVGAEAPPGIGALLAEHVRRRSPLTEVTSYECGQVNYPVIIGVE